MGNDAWPPHSDDVITLTGKERKIFICKTVQPTANFRNSCFKS